jgi:hypothetical protein
MQADSTLRAVGTRAIRTTDNHTSCDVCGRTLLRGERAEVYLGGGERKAVCDLCSSRALHEGWVREGTVPADEARDGRSEGRRSLFGRLRNRRFSGGTGTPPPGEEELEDQSWSQPAPVPRRRREQVREPRHVHAIPLSAEQKMASAVELFNNSEHRRTVSGIARSLGVPEVSVLPSPARASLIRMTVSWELCWYRYEVDLSDDQPSVRISGQGSELDELALEERSPNASADEAGILTL